MYTEISTDTAMVKPDNMVTIFTHYYRDGQEESKVRCESIPIRYVPNVGDKLMNGASSYRITMITLNGDGTYTLRAEYLKEA